MTAILWLNVLLMTVFFGLWVAIPMWLVIRRPDRERKLAPAPAVRRVPEPGAEHSGYQRVA